jgi:hypothetical protein
VGEEWLTLGCLLHLEEQPPAKIAECIRSGLADLTLSYELDGSAEPDEAFVHFGAALAVGDRPAAGFLAFLPPVKWGFPTSHEWQIPAWLTRTSFALFMGQASEAGIGMDLMQGLLFESEIPEETAPRKPEFEATFRLLEALQKKDAAAFSAQLPKRQAARALALKEEAGPEPLALIDFQGLGLCRMALDAGMRVEAADPYLPLELLRVPPPAAPASA